MPKKLTPEVKAIRDRCVVDVDDFDWWLEQKGWAWQGLDRGDYGITLDDAQLIYVWEDPVLWCRAYLEEPDPPENLVAAFTDGDVIVPYEFWDYQQVSVRAWYQDCVHQDGAEVGKTREIIALVLWGCISGFGFSKRQPSILVGAPQQTHLDEIIMAIEEVMGVADGQHGKKPILHQFWGKPKKHPHTMHRFITPNPFTPNRPYIGRCYYRPAGHDGVAFRGVHVNGMAIMDEAAKVASDTCWSEFRRAKKPGCIERVYSVPDGRRDTEFYRLTTIAKPNLDPDETGARLFRWSKDMMPHPFWSLERRRKFIDDYGGIDSPGYQRNVLGNHGEPEDTVFPWHHIEPSLVEVPEYRTLKLTAEPNTNTLMVECYSCGLIRTEDGRKSPDKNILIDQDLDLRDYTDVDDRDMVRRNVRDLIKQNIILPAGATELYIGCDLGYSNDPSEYMIWSRVGRDMKRIGRIHLKGASYDLQCEIIYCLDELLNFNAVAIGVDLGSAGVAVVQMMQSLDIYDDGNYADRMIGFQFSMVEDAIDEDGNAVIKEDDRGNEKVVRWPLKQIATEMWSRRYQKHNVIQPYDDEVVQHYLGHTATESKSSDKLIYSKENDHTIDADRVAKLAKVYFEDQGDVFATGAYVR